MALGTPGVQTVPQLIRTLGSQATQAINDGADEVVFDATVKDIIGHHGMQQLIEQYCFWNGKPGMFSIDHGSVRISPQVEAVEDPVHEMPQSRSKKSRTPRPPNAFILYRKAHHPALKEAHPDLHNNEISIILGNQWRTESQDIKQRYYSLAQEIKDQHSMEHPDYVYKPRKTSDKKRRMSRKKAAKLERLFESLAKDSGSDGVQEILGMPNDHNESTYFDELASDGNADYVLLGDLDLDQNNLDSLLENRESFMQAQGDTKRPTGSISPLYSNVGGLSGYIAPSTAIVLDDANSIIKWAENREFTPVATSDWNRTSPQMQRMCNMEKTARNHRLATAEAYRQIRLQH